MVIGGNVRTILVLSKYLCIMKIRATVLIRCVLVILLIGAIIKSYSQNPIIHNHFTADPTARVFGDSIYLYPSHDILAEQGKGQPGWFCMEDYHVFSSADLVHWRDGGMLLSQNDVPWADTTSYSMWAPDCIKRDGKYYFYFPTKMKGSDGESKFSIGVALGERPGGPFKVMSEPIAGVKGIDPNVFIDDDGQAYLFWAEGDIMGAKLKRNMLDLDSKVKILEHLPAKGLKEGPFLFKNKGKYYLTYPHVEDKTERLEYAVSDKPLGPFQPMGVIMEASDNCWTNHQSIVKFKGQWYLFYHSNDYSPRFDKARSARIDSLFFNADGTIREVKPTLRGVGISNVTDTIQVDRYSSISDSGAGIYFLDTNHHFKGWSLKLSTPGSWVRYNSVDFGLKKNKIVQLRLKADQEGLLLLKAISKNGENVNIKTLANIQYKKSDDFVVINAIISDNAFGLCDLILSNGSDSPGNVEIDWILFQ
ncbi:family 43 glycosylhydrolase [Arachidicoccus rhizosphaerae]|nr:family 43 glycosylhydrolase [Arachidicoccus rhizosphaerae]